MISLYTALQKHLDPAMQAMVVDEMKRRGHDDVNWDTLRYGTPSCFCLVQLGRRLASSTLPMALAIAQEELLGDGGPSWNPCNWLLLKHAVLVSPPPFMVSSFFFSLAAVFAELPSRKPSTCLHLASPFPIFLPTFHQQRSSIEDTTMPKWEDIREDLFEAIIQVQAPLSKDQQEQVVQIMQARGHNMGWNAIRYVPRRHILLSCPGKLPGTGRILMLLLLPHLPVFS